MDTYSSNQGHVNTLQFRSSKQNTIGNTHTIIGTALGRVEWYGNTGSAFVRSGYIAMVQGSSTETDGDLTINAGGHIAIDTGGSESLRIDSSGNVGIGGITVPTGLLSIPAADTTTKPQIRFQSGLGTTLADAALSTTDDSGGTSLLIGSNQYYSGGSRTRFTTSRSGSAIDFGYTGNMKFYTGSGSSDPVEVMRIDASGTMLLTTPSGGNVGYLNIKEAGNGDIRFGKGEGVNYDAILGTWTNNSVRIYSNGVARLRIDSLGRVLVGVLRDCRLFVASTGDLDLGN